MVSIIIVNQNLDSVIIKSEITIGYTGALWVICCTSFEILYTVFTYHIGGSLCLTLSSLYALDEAAHFTRLVMSSGLESKQEELESPITSDDEVGLDAGLTPDLQLDIQEAINKISLKLDPCCSAEGVCEGPLPVTDKRFKVRLYIGLYIGRNILYSLWTMLESW